MVLFAAALSLMCKLPSASVLIGHEAVMARSPPRSGQWSSASHAPVALCVNIRVITPFGLQGTRRHSAKIEAMRSW